MDGESLKRRAASAREGGKRMFDRTMEDIALRMKRPDLLDLPPRGLPEGYSFRFFRPGDEKHWARIETSAGEFDREEDAYPAFEYYYGAHKNLLEHRMLFLLDETQTPVGTATAWTDDGMGRVHWVALAQSHQSKRLSKPLVVETLYLMREQGYTEAFLTTQPPSWVAIRVYLACGFIPVIADDTTARGWQLVRDKIGAERWREPIKTDGGK